MYTEGVDTVIEPGETLSDEAFNVMVYYSDDTRCMQWSVEIPDLDWTHCHGHCFCLPSCCPAFPCSFCESKEMLLSFGGKHFKTCHFTTDDTSSVLSL